MRKILILVLNKVYYIWGRISAKSLAKHLFWRSLGKRLDFRSPKDLNEKINYLKFYSDTTLWTRLADKYEVRDYVEKRGLRNILIPLYGVYDSAEEIKFSDLPDEFVIKPTHGSGDVEIVQNKLLINKKILIKKLKRSLNARLGIVRAEPHYLKIKPRLVVEKLIKDDSIKAFSISLIDYKIWCFNGIPYSIEVYYDRKKDGVKVLAYDLEWNDITDTYFEFRGKFSKGKPIAKPETLDKMIECAQILSQGFPEVRVDLYSVGKNVYFGEMTFTSSGGYDNTLMQSRLDDMGAHILI